MPRDSQKPQNIIVSRIPFLHLSKSVLLHRAYFSTMGRAFVVNLDNDDPEANIIACRTCHTHLALRQDFMYLIPVPWVPEIEKILCFSDVVNVIVDGAEHHREYAVDFQTLADIRCVKCGNVVGDKVVKDNVWKELDHHQNNEEGRYRLIIEKLEHWKANVYRNANPEDFPENMPPVQP